MAIRLSKRLTTLAGMVSTGNRLADVGTDHGYIPIQLCLDGVIPSAIAMDINEGPLERAREHITEYGLEEKIQTRLSDGMKHLHANEADTVLIAGMGGGLVRKIVSEAGDGLEGVSELILQPQSEIPETRRFVREHGFTIIDEDMILEDGKYYPMMRVVPNELAAIPLPEVPQELSDAYGPWLLSRKHPVLLQWIDREEKVTKDIIERLNQQISKQPESEALLLRREEMQQKLASLECAKGYME